VNNSDNLVEPNLYTVQSWYHVAREANCLRRILAREDYEQIKNNFRPEFDSILKSLENLQKLLEANLRANDYGKDDFDRIFDDESGVYDLVPPTTWERDKA
jgi:molecular chaperone GrpE (heat shock protein)